jgi:hypothetical protein
MHQLGRVLHRPGLKPVFAAVGAEDSGFAEKSSVRCFGADRSDRNSGASITSSLTNDNAFGGSWRSLRPRLHRQPGSRYPAFFRQVAMDRLR